MWLMDLPLHMHFSNDHGEIQEHFVSCFGCLLFVHPSHSPCHQTLFVWDVLWWGLYCVATNGYISIYVQSSSKDVIAIFGYKKDDKIQKYGIVWIECVALNCMELMDVLLFIRPQHSAKDAYCGMLPVLTDTWCLLWCVHFRAVFKSRPCVTFFWIYTPLSALPL